jgi:hypothetical protein
MKTRPGLLFSLFVFCAPIALPATITGGTTAVALNSTFVATLTGAGISPAAIGPGMLTGTTATFPITGGDTTTGMILHSGGLSFTRGTNSAMIENFAIDLNTLLLNGEVIANGGTPTMNVNLFNIESGNTLTINSALASGLSAVFLVPNLTGAPGGVATVSPVTASPVPEPSALALLSLGGVLAAVLRRSSKHGARFRLGL